MGETEEITASKEAMEEEAIIEEQIPITLVIDLEDGVANKIEETVVEAGTPIEEIIIEVDAPGSEKNKSTWTREPAWPVAVVTTSLVRNLAACTVTRIN